MGVTAPPLAPPKLASLLPSGPSVHAVFSEVVSVSAAAAAAEAAAAPANRQLSSKCYLPFCAQTEAFWPCPTTTTTATLRLPNGSTQSGQSSMRSPPGSTLEPETSLKFLPASLEWFSSCIKLLITRFLYRNINTNIIYIFSSTKESIVCFCFKKLSFCVEFRINKKKESEGRNINLLKRINIFFYSYSNTRYYLDKSWNVYGKMLFISKMIFIE